MLDQIIASEELIEQQVFKNCLEVMKTDKGLLPVRFTEKQYAEYAKNGGFLLRANCPAGVCLDMQTTAASIHFNYTIIGFVRPWLAFDVFINGIFVESMSSPSMTEGDYEFNYQMPAGSEVFNRMTIYLPHNVHITIGDVSIPKDALWKEAPEYGKNLLCLGDSITQGMDSRIPSSTYPILLARYMECNLLNQGVGGYVFDENSLDEDCSYRPDYITVAYGTNDWNKCESLAEFQDKCSTYMTKLVRTYKEVPIYVMTPIWRKDWEQVRASGTFEEIADAIREICNEYSEIDVVDGLELIPHLPYYFTDNAHPTNEGFLHIAMNLSRQIRK